MYNTGRTEQGRILRGCIIIAPWCVSLNKNAVDAKTKVSAISGAGEENDVFTTQTLDPPGEVNRDLG
jgi:hypothetical protein